MARSKPNPRRRIHVDLDVAKDNESTDGDRPMLRVAQDKRRSTRVHRVVVRCSCGNEVARIEQDGPTSVSIDVLDDSVKLDPFALVHGTHRRTSEGNAHLA